MKPPATKAAILLRLKLSALVARGIAGEATAAAGKLARLDARYDFDAPAIPEQQEGDIFAGIEIPYDAEARTVATMESTECDLAAFVAWALGSGCRIQTTLRPLRNWSTGIAAHVPPGDLAKVSRLAQYLADSYRAAWSRASAVLRTQDRALFFRGLLDGTTGDERQSGELLRTPTASKACKAKRRAVVATGVSVHPYALALDLGRRIRLAAPADEICATIDEQTRQQISA